MNDNEIIKAWECCSAPICNCKECPMEGVNNCYTELKYKTLDLINRLQSKNKELDEKNVLYKGLIDRQKAEIEKLEKARQRQAQFLGEERGQKYELLNKIGTAKSEAIKEFAERLKEKIAHIPAWGSVAEKKIDNLVKEMTEQSVNYGSSKTEGNG